MPCKQPPKESSNKKPIPNLMLPKIKFYLQTTVLIGGVRAWRLFWAAGLTVYYHFSGRKASNGF